MKIIAVIPQYGDQRYLLEATETEIARLIGHRFSSECRQMMVVGNEIRVNEMFDQLKRLADAQDDLDRASTTLHSVANLVHIIDPMIEAVIKPKEEV